MDSPTWTGYAKNDFAGDLTYFISSSVMDHVSLVGHFGREIGSIVKGCGKYWSAYYYGHKSLRIWRLMCFGVNYLFDEIQNSYDHKIY